MAPARRPPCRRRTLVVVAIDRIGRTWQDILQSICELRDRGVKIRSLADTVANLTLVDAKAGFTGKTGSGPQHRQRSGRRDGQPRRRVPWWRAPSLAMP